MKFWKQLCCLKMEEAAAASLVSQRWLKIWKTTLTTRSRLDFNVDNINQLEKGWSREDLINKNINAVNEAVNLYKAPTLDEFDLKVCSLNSDHCHHINAWMDFAAKKQVKKLSLNLSTNTYGHATLWVIIFIASGIWVSTNRMSCPFPQFPQSMSKVEHLKLQMGLPCFQIPIHRLPGFFEAAPCSNTFSVEVGYSSFNHPANANALQWLDKLIPDKVKDHPCQYLKVVKLETFAGGQYEVDFVLHLLKCPQLLSKLFFGVNCSNHC
ncbi:uncharacterized protein LOC132805392 isoform X3 [Ziziphus jujuba]|uniref:Uncharacterized protein LOC132805392 isoform X3 n=1 Tax=Ziziphus jujuba TaxID=326968 RepID=A0ABM4AHK5_ZIZJJ|nr:uncharacterized protein LOC132805392 isoform X3 [Ziziphus jujuba]